MSSPFCLCKEMISIVKSFEGGVFDIERNERVVEYGGCNYIGIIKTKLHPMPIEDSCYYSVIIMQIGQLQCIVVGRFNFNS